MPERGRAAFGVALAALLLGGAAEGAAAEGQTIELPQADREKLEALLGKGVVGRAVPAAPLSSDLEGLRDGTRTYQIVAGGKGTEEHVVEQLKRDSSGRSWRYRVGDDLVLSLSQTGDGGLAIESEQDTDEGVISRFAPPEPLLVPDLQPGASKDYTIGVEVYDLGKPDDLAHSGSLKVTYSHLGAYEVSVPAGTYDATLIKWVYQGKVGPADVEDTQYRLVVDETGMVAAIDRKKISAFLLYHDDARVGKVLAKQP